MGAQISTLEENNISNKIYTIRGSQVMLDRDLAELYQVETRALNQAVRRNSDRFPSDFMFQLSDEESKALRSQIVILNDSSRGQHRKYLPYVFTEQGVAMLAGILKSQIAVKISIQIIQAFVEMRKMVTNNTLLFQRMDRIEKQQIITETKLEEIFQAIEDKKINWLSHNQV